MTAGIVITKVRGKTELQALADLGNAKLTQDGVTDRRWVVDRDCIRCEEIRED